MDEQINTLQKCDNKDNNNKNDDAAIKIWMAATRLLQLAQNCVEHPGIWITERPLWKLFTQMYDKKLCLHDFDPLFPRQK